MLLTATLLTATLLPLITIAPDNWSFEHRGGLSDVRSGKRALHIVLQDSDPARRTAEVRHEPVTVQAEERVSAAVWHKGSAGAVRIAVDFLSAEGKTIGTSRGNSSRSGSRWAKIEVQALPPTGAKRASLVIQLEGDGHASFDDATLKSGPTDLIANGGFEKGMSGWEAARDAVGAAWVNNTPFVPWGFNYDRTIHKGRDLILEETPIEKIERDFRVARRLGANALRVFLDLSRFTPRFLEMDSATLEHFDRVVRVARKLDLKLDVTGLSHIVGMPEWFRDRSTEEIERAERFFWQTIAKRYAGEPIIMTFNLQNEPVVVKPDGDLATVGCFKMSEGRNFCYVNRHRQKPGLSREESARRWTASMVEAIKSQDRERLVTMGMLSPASPVIGGLNPGFTVAAVAPVVDYISIHFYPQRPAPDPLQDNQDRLEMVLRYAGGFGKPVVHEEWFPIYPPGTRIPEGEWFPRVMKASTSNAAGWFTFYHALQDDRPEDSPIPSQHMRQFAENATFMRTSFEPRRARATTRIAIKPSLLWTSRDEVDRLLSEYQKLRRSGEQPDFEVIE